MKLFIGSLPYNITESELSELCAQFGTVIKAHLVLDSVSRQPRGFGFVEMSTRSEGHKVMEELNGKVFKHRTLICNEAKPVSKKRQGRR